MKKYALFMVLFNLQTKQTKKGVLFHMKIIPRTNRKIHRHIFHKSSRAHLPSDCYFFQLNYNQEDIS